MNNNDILQALVAARTFKPEIKEAKPTLVPIVEPTSFVSMYDQLDQLDANPFNTPRTTS